MCKIHVRYIDRVVASEASGKVLTIFQGIWCYNAPAIDKRDYDKKPLCKMQPISCNYCHLEKKKKKSKINDFYCKQRNGKFLVAIVVNIHAAKIINKLLAWRENKFDIQCSDHEHSKFDATPCWHQSVRFDLVQSGCIELHQIKFCMELTDKLVSASSCTKPVVCVFFIVADCVKKRYWKQHKKKCISTFTKGFDKSQLQTLQNLSLFLTHSIKVCVSQMHRMFKLTESIKN